MKKFKVTLVHNNVTVTASVKASSYEEAVQKLKQLLGIKDE